MGRLIDADALIEVLKAEKKQDRSRAYGEHECDLITGTIAMCIDSVKATPTAYDIEKVVAELEEQAEQYSRRALELVDKSTEARIHNKGKACSYEHAIDIVKRGGVE